MGTGASDLTPPRPPEGRPPPGPNVYGPLRMPAQQRGQALHGGGGGGAARPMTVVQKTKMVRNLCNVRRDSLRLVRDTGQTDRYRLELRYSAEVACSITAYFLHEEDVVMVEQTGGSRLRYRPRYPGRDCVVGLSICPAGPDQLYVSTDSVDLGGGVLADRDLVGNEGVIGGAVTAPAYYPLYIVIKPLLTADLSEEGGAEISSQITMANLAIGPAKNYVPKFVKQKIETSTGAVFVLQEIYGIAKDGEGGGGLEESLASSTSGGSAVLGGGDLLEGGGDDDVSSADCVICLTNKRELTVLPCRHMCVCRYCATECFQSQDSKCPICRNPAQALLKLTVGQTTDNSIGPLKTD